MFKNINFLNEYKIKKYMMKMSNYFNIFVLIKEFIKRSNIKDVFLIYNTILKYFKASEQFEKAEKVVKLKKQIKKVMKLPNELNDLKSKNIEADIDDTYNLFCIDFADETEQEETIKKGEIEEIKEKFPTITRKCYHCKTELSLSDFFYANCHLDAQQIEKLWISEYLEFLCCDCYSECVIIFKGTHEEEEEITDLQIRLITKDENYTSPGMWTSIILKTLLYCEKNIEYDVRDLFTNSRWDEAKYYLEIIEIIKRNKIRYCIDAEDNEVDKYLYKLVKRNAPEIEFTGKTTFIVKNSLFYRKLNDIQKAILYIYRKDENVESLPVRFNTPEFLEKKDTYFEKKNNKIVFLDPAIELCMNLNTFISHIGNGDIFLSL